jgi:glutathione S-transferase
MTAPVAIKGAPGSPYTRKMLAVMRYRRLPYRFLVGPQADALPKPKVELLPTFYFPGPDGALQAVTDSTPIIRRLEAEHAGRAVLPFDPVIRFLDALIEDYADEWLTKAMFHYRWRYQADIEKAGDILPRWRDITAPEEMALKMKAYFSERQIGRLGYVGSNDTTAETIEQSYRRFLALFEARLTVSPFLFGMRPGASDFAAFGQLTALTHFDPTPMAIALGEAKRVYAWVDLAEDLSGLAPGDDDWTARDAIPPTLTAVFAEIGRVYAPLLLANAAALAAGQEQVETVIDGRPWTQAPFPYQAKCLAELRRHWDTLVPEDRSVAASALQGTGCEALFAA